MKIRLNKVYDAIPMTREKAEKKLGYKIKNLIHGDFGYWIENQWFPKEVIERKSVPYTTNTDKIKFLINELSAFTSELQDMPLDTDVRNELLNTINKLTKQIKNGKQA